MHIGTYNNMNNGKYHLLKYRTWPHNTVVLWWTVKVWKNSFQKRKITYLYCILRNIIWVRAWWLRVEDDLIEPLKSDIIIAINNNYYIDMIYCSRGHQGVNNRLQHNIIYYAYVRRLPMTAMCTALPRPLSCIIIIQCRI